MKLFTLADAEDMLAQENTLLSCEGQHDLGHDVTLIDPWPAHVEAIRSGGMHLYGMTEPENRVIKVDAISQRHSLQRADRAAETERQRGHLPDLPLRPGYRARLLVQDVGGSDRVDAR